MQHTQLDILDITGASEILLEKKLSKKTIPSKVTELLHAYFEKKDNSIITRDELLDLPIAQRQTLMIKLLISIGKDIFWYKTSCKKCEEPFDYSVDIRNIPFDAGKANLPNIKISLGQCALRAISGRDQAIIATLDNITQAVRILAARAIVSINAETNIKPEQLANLNENDIALISETLDSASPQFATQMDVTCCYCKHEQAITIDFYHCDEIVNGTIHEEIIKLANSCYWSEASILAMPQSRRKAYIKALQN